MKKSLVARGFIGAVASLLGVAAVGCGAEVGGGAAGDSAEIGSSAQALQSAGTTDSINNSEVLDYAAGCEIKLSGQSYFLAAGGRLTTTPTVSNKWRLYDPSVATAANRLIAEGTFDTGRYAASMIQVPGATNKCIMAGGYGADHLKVTSDTTIVFQINAPVAPATIPTISVTKPTGFEARGEFQLAKCGTGSVIAVGGATRSSLHGSGSTILSSNTVQVWNGTNWANVATGLSTPRSNFGLAPATNGTDFVAVGGEGASAGPLDLIEALRFSTTTNPCDTMTRRVVSNGTPSDGDELSLARNKTVAFRINEATVSGKLITKYVVPGGDDGSAVTNTSDVVLINWTDASISLETGPNLVANSGAALRLPTLVIGESDVPVLIGGETFASAGVDSLQKWDLSVTASPYTNGFVNSSSADLAVARGASAAAYMTSQASNNVVVLGGHNGTPSLLGSFEEIDTP